MIKRMTSITKGDGLTARSLRGAFFSMFGVVGANLLRLASNLILTRLLFPEAFGLMALVQVFVSGLQMFSDIGLATSIKQSKRGDDIDFLNMAWTLQIIRGVVLWLVACALAYPAAQLYDEPMLAQLLPLVGFIAVIDGFETTKVPQAGRHLKLGRQTLLRLGTKVIGLTITVLLAWWLQSVWALAIGGVIGSALRVIILRRFMVDGHANRLHWDRASLGELIGFGKYIFLSTVAGFLINQGDRAILGGFVSIAELGIYNIAFFLGTLPLLVAKTMANKVLLPLYRMKNPTELAGNRAKIFRARRLVVLAGLGISVCLAWSGVFVIEFLYDPRYALAGPMVVLFGFATVVQVTFSGYDPALLANGDSRRFFILLAVTALAQTAFLYFGIQAFGVAGAILAPMLAALLAYPLRTRFLRLYNANDNLGDALFLVVGFALTGLACWVQWEQITRILG